LLLTDPQYGIEIGESNRQDDDCTHLHKKGYLHSRDTYDEFVNDIVPRLNEWIDLIGRAIIFSGPHIHEQRKPVAIGGIYNQAAIGRTPWGSKNFLPILFYGSPPNLAGTHRPTVFNSTRASDKNGHPCPKPIEWINWLIVSYSLNTDTIIDPFTGSGTTLVAAKQLNRKSIGIEIEEKYCEIAANRLRQEVLDLSI
jgi:hypothetical protein